MTKVEQQAWAVYEKAQKRARAKYDKVERPAWDEYQAALKRAEAKYRKAKKLAETKDR